MEDFRRQFLLEATAKLEGVIENRRRAEHFSESFKRETLRTLHTIKGTAQTFGFSPASRIAHALETMLAARQVPEATFFEGVELLAESLKRENFEIPPTFLEKIGIENSGNFKTNFAAAENLTAEIPPELFSQLSNQEKITLAAAQRNEQNFFCLEIGFELKDFADGLIKFREVLNSNGEIIATLPSPKFSREGKIGFQILYATPLSIAAVESIAQANDAEITYGSSEDFSANDLRSAARHAVRHGKEIAARTGKRINFKIDLEELEISAEKIKVVFDVLLHLIRNAVDHAIKHRGNIEISLKTDFEDLYLKVADDGDGINLRAVKAKAIERNLIAPHEKLTEKELINLIFQPEFSTKAAVSEISGRGIGLDAVKETVERSGGTISVETENGKGTTFKIVLPLGQN